MEKFILILTALLVIFVLWWFRRPAVERRRRPEVVQTLLSDVKINQALAKTFHSRKKRPKFLTANWKVYQTQLDFLTQLVRASLADTFALAESLNQQIKATNQPSNLDLDKLKELLAKSQQGLEEWLVVHTGKRELPPKYPSIFDSLWR